MTLNLDMDADYQKEFDFDLEETGKKVMEGTLDHENCPYEAEVNLVLTDNEEIRRTNREFRDIDRETDVLSFPMLEYDRPGDFSHAEEDESCFNPDTGELILGDIMISVPKLKEQAEAYGHSQLREHAFLITHSLLHLMGYDHMEAEEAVLMENRQREILETLGITR